MNILFVCPYVNNVHFLEPAIKLLKKNVIKDNYTFICLNDAPDIDSGEENYLNLVSILSENDNCYKEIYEECLSQNVEHIKIPQTIHIKNRPNHGSQRHGEICNWFLRNIDNIYPDYKNYTHICLYDADLFLIKPTCFSDLLLNFDFACPVIYTKQYPWPQPSVFFINIRTVVNFKELDFGINYKYGNDMGSGITDFWIKYPQYNIKPIGKFNGFQNGAFEIESETIKQIDGHYYDLWLNESFVHLRWGWGGGAGESQHRNQKNLNLYLTKMQKIFNKYNIVMDFEKWVYKNKK